MESTERTPAIVNDQENCCAAHCRFLCEFVPFESSLSRACESRHVPGLT